MSADGWLDFTVQPLDGDVDRDLEQYWSVWLPRRPALLFVMFHSYTVRVNYTTRLECASPICGHHSPGEPSCYLTCPRRHQHMWTDGLNPVRCQYRKNIWLWPVAFSHLSSSNNTGWMCFTNAVTLDSSEAFQQLWFLIAFILQPLFKEVVLLHAARIQRFQIWNLAHPTWKAPVWSFSRIPSFLCHQSACF